MVGVNFIQSASTSIATPSTLPLPGWALCVHWLLMSHYREELKLWKVL
jgi:hypothetical protein